MVKVKTGSACSFVNVCVRSQDKTGEVRIWGLRGLEGGCGGLLVRKLVGRAAHSIHSVLIKQD